MSRLAFTTNVIYPLSRALPDKSLTTEIANSSVVSNRKKQIKLNVWQLISEKGRLPIFQIDISPSFYIFQDMKLNFSKM